MPPAIKGCLKVLTHESFRPYAGVGLTVTSQPAL